MAVNIINFSNLTMDTGFGRALATKPAEVDDRTVATGERENSVFEIVQITSKGDEESNHDENIA